MIRVEKMINEMIDDESFSLNKLQERFTGFAPEGKTIYSVWEKYIEERRETSLGTAKTNKDVMNSFIKDMGSNVAFADINRSFFRDLGLFLFMYLGDGQNLADTLRLEYDEWYFATHGQQFRFLSHKTEGRVKMTVR